MDLKNRLIEPDENSTTSFEPFYQITPKELDEINRQYHAEQLRLHVVISRLQKLQRFDLANYRDGEYGIDTEREENDNGNYIDAYEIDLLIKDLTNGL